MATSTIEQERIRPLNEEADALLDDEDANEHDDQPEGGFVLYWMQASQRAEHNPALEYAIQRANDLGVAVVVAATLIPDYPEATARSYAFMLGGLQHALEAIERRGGTVVIRIGEPADEIAELATSGNSKAAIVVVDRGYLRHQREWRSDLADRLDVPVVQVEGEAVVPIDLVSDKQETAARTIRPKINEHRDRFLVELDTTSIDRTRAPSGFGSSGSDRSNVTVAALGDVDDMLDRLGVERSADLPEPIDWLEPGTAAARATLDEFLDAVADYDDRRNEYNDAAGTSMMSPYFHYGQISPVAVALEVVDRAGDDAEGYLEEMIVRRELAMNFTEHCADYDSWSGLPGWARESLEQHEDDEREHVYTSTELENGETHDEVWNAIMAEIRRNGWVHNQLRMYWGKQFVQWTNTPQHAYRTLLGINNRWFVDGRDPSSYSNVGWCFGVHDQGFQEREVSGKLRPFTTAALKRKDDLDQWVDEHPPD